MEDRQPRTQAGHATRNPITWLLNFFSSVTLGVTLMSLLFVYMTIGSAGLFYPANDPDGLGWHLNTYMLRQHPVFELTEFEWFHTWVFDVLVALICVNIIVATLRRIPFSLINLGVWMIHSGIILLALGSVIYFATKVEGDTPVYRRQVEIRVPGAEPVTMVALPGATKTVVGDGGMYSFAVQSTAPEWPILSEGHEGVTAYSVMVAVRTPSASFIRQLLDGFEEFTEDVIPGRGRVKKLEEFGGTALVDDSIQLSLAPWAQDRFWIKDSASLQVRRAGTLEWIQRPLHGLPRYNDYVSSPEHVWSTQPIPKRPIDIRSRASSDDDPLADADVRITGYLRYALQQDAPSLTVPENPVVGIKLILPDGNSSSHELYANDERFNSTLSEHVRFVQVDTEDDVATLAAPWGRRLTFSIPGNQTPVSIDVTGDLLEIGPGEWTPVGQTGYAFRIIGLDDALQVGINEMVWVVRAVIQRPDGSEFERWIANEPQNTRDVFPGDETREPEMTMPSDEIVIDYLVSRPETVIVVAGPDAMRLRVLHGGAWGQTSITEAAIGQAIPLESGQGIVIEKYGDLRPQIVPLEQRDKDMDTQRSLAMIRVAVTAQGQTQEHWLPFHRYSFESVDLASPALAPYQPKTYTLPDGERVEVMFARQWKKLPDPVVLDDFILTTRVGGFTGSATSVRDWTSEVSFDDDGTRTQPVKISTNNPKEHDGMWFFQSYWEPPRAPSEFDPGSGGLNFTGLGVGNRHGVRIQLLGCCIAVAGMIYAFYIKPILKRRRQDSVHAELEGGSA